MDKDPRLKDRTIIIGTLLLAIASTATTMILPAASTRHESWWSGHIPVAVAVVSADLFIGSAILLLYNIRPYRARMQQIYRLITLCALLVAAGAVLNMYEQASNTMRDTWALATAGLPFIASGVLCCLAARLLGAMVGYTISWLRMLLWHTAALLVVAACVVLPHTYAVGTPAALTDLSNLMLILGGVYNVVAGSAIIRTSRYMGAHYADTIALLGAAFCGGGLVVAAYGLVHMFTHIPSAAVMTGFNICAVAVGAVFVRVNYLLVQLKDVR